MTAPTTTMAPQRHTRPDQATRPKGWATAPVLAAALAIWLAGPAAQAQDWTQWGRDNSRNMVAPGARGLPATFGPGKAKPGSEETDLATTTNVKWVAKLGSQAYGNVTVAGGRVFVGTNNESPRDKRFTGDYSILMCFDEATGKFLWQLVVPKLGAGKVSDWEYLGICSSPHIEDDRLYLVTSRCEVICLDVKGQSNGNDGPYKDEGQYMVGPGKKPVEVTAADADILWVFDMRDELGVFPHNIASSSVLVLGDRVYATTSNGQDWSHKYIPSPRAPSMAVLDKKTGKYLGEEASGIGARLMHSGWSSPAAGKVQGKELVFFGAGDGFLYGFAPEPGPAKDDIHPLQEVFRFDCNPPEHKTDKDGKPFKYPHSLGPSEIIATPVLHKDRIYVSVGQDPEHGEGVGALSCIDATKTGDITKTGLVWRHQQYELDGEKKSFGRVIATVAIADGLLYVGEYAGKVHCLDADTGKLHWVHDTRSHIWGSTLVADGKVYVGTEDGDLVVLAHGKDKKLLGTTHLGAPVYATPVVANGVLYVQSMTHLFAVQSK